MTKKIIYYKDEINDDFGDSGLKAWTVPADFPFARSGHVWSVMEFILYRLIATPLVWLIAKAGFGLRVKNRKALKKLRGTGYFLYGNHTNGMMDAYSPSLAMFARHVHIVTGSQTVSTPALARIVSLMGAIPLPGTAKGFRPFLEALHLRISQKRVVTIFPEAHIWPWYTGIRPFSDGSFNYPVIENVPAVAMVTTYRKRKIFNRLWPCVTVTLSEPFYPDSSLPQREAAQALRNEIYNFMCGIAESDDNYAYYEYRKEDAGSAQT